MTQKSNNNTSKQKSCVQFFSFDGAGGMGEALRSAALCHSAGRLKLSGKNPPESGPCLPSPLCRRPPPGSSKTASKTAPAKGQQNMCQRDSNWAPKRYAQITKIRQEGGPTAPEKGYQKFGSQEVTQSAPNSSQNEFNVEPRSLKNRTWMENAGPRCLLLFMALRGHRPFQEELKNRSPKYSKMAPKWSE